MKRWFVPLFIALFSISAYSQLYADITFEVRDNGEVEINGNTNYDTFKGVTNSLTSKQGELWLLNITSPVFDEYLYEVILPKYSVINYIKANSQVRIEEKSGTITITATGSDKPIDIKIQYTIDKEERTASIVRLISAIVIIIIIGAVGYLIKKNVKHTPKKELKRELYTDRQLTILDYLQKHGTVTQAHLEKDLKLPKSSLSRNVETLVQKGVIFKEAKGMSNVIGFKE